MARERVLIAGMSTRAVAESAARSGCRVAAVDAFGDLDHRARPLVSFPHDLHRRYDAAAAARASRRIPCDAVAYTSNFENHPEAVALLARGRELLGTAPAALRRVRDPLALARFLGSVRMPALTVRASPPPTAAGHSGRTGSRRWLSKPRASGGGHGIVPWRAGDPVPRSRVIQERASGASGSIALLADGTTATAFALSWQLVGERAFGASGFRYAGSILGAPPGISRRVWAAAAERLSTAAHLIAREFGLRGVFGLDFILEHGTPYITEVNPRFTASMELVERACGWLLFAAHVAACRGRRPRIPGHVAPQRAPIVGKAVLYARRSVVLGDTRDWLSNDSVRDVPHPGERIARGRPICTIFARGRSSAGCHAALVRRARMLYRKIEGNRGSAR